MTLKQRLLALDEEGYKPSTGEIGTEAKTEIERLEQCEARYNWLIAKVFARGETCLALYEEFGGAPLQGESKSQFMARYIDEKLPPNTEVDRASGSGRTQSYALTGEKG